MDKGSLGSLVPDATVSMTAPEIVVHLPELNVVLGKSSKNGNVASAQEVRHETGFR